MGPKTKSEEDVQIMFELSQEELDDLVADLNETLRLGRQNWLAGVDETALALFKSRVSCLESCFDKFSSVFRDAKVYGKRLGEDCTSLNEQKTTARKMYYEILSISQNLLTLEDVPIPPSKERPSIKLPIIPLPQFNGELTMWPAFKDIYLSLVHTNADLDAMRKFHYLRASLKGPALQTVAKIPFTASDYNQAWAALMKRYDNKRILATHYLMNIFNFKPINKNSAANLENFCETVLENAEAFRNLRLDDPSGFLLYAFALRLLDARTRERFEDEYGRADRIPAFSEFSDFIHQECLKWQTNALTTLPQTSFSSPDSASKPPKLVFSSLGVANEGKQCPICQEEHRIYECSKFRELAPNDRYARIRSLNRCLNCFACGHFCLRCPSDKRCRYCNRSHHSMLHSREATMSEKAPPVQKMRDTRKPGWRDTLPPSEETESPENTGAETVFSSAASGEPNVLLGTAQVRIRDATGTFQNVRVLVDSGSQRSFITTTCVTRLAIAQRPTPQRLVGLGNQIIPGGNKVAECILVPRQTEVPRFRTTAIILDRISGNMPFRKLDDNIKSRLSGFRLADPQFDEPGPIDFLLGADLFGGILTGTTFQVPMTKMYALRTVFGDILIGETTTSPSMSIHSFLVTENNSSATPELAQVMSKFWEVEEVPAVSRRDPDDIWCEELFEETHRRDQQGRYIGKLPLKKSVPNLMSSKEGALRRLHALEHRFSKNTTFRDDYNRVVRDYIDQDYMTEAVRPGRYFLPHHGVIKDSTSTKLRVVFDASHKCNNGSLSEHLVTGPKLQSDIKEVLIRFRVYKYAMVTDICQMYLQIIVNENDRTYQHLFHRFESDQAVKEFEFARLTFGMSCSPYLALRVIQQLLTDEGKAFPKAKIALSQNIYMDDILTGANSIPEALKLQHELIEILRRGGFTPKKWSSNSERLLETLPPDSRVSVVPLANLEDATVKILGLQWEPKKDCLSYKIQPQEYTPTKRGILSTIARMYDPVGYLSPVIFKTKCIMQNLWELKLDWDEPIPDGMRKEWIQFVTELPSLCEINIPRCMFPGPTKDIKVIGFADASSLGYAAVIYLRIETQDGRICSRLLTAKTRLAPLKPLSIPRLELCAALLLINTLKPLQPFLEELHVSSVSLMSDSSTVLAWLKLPYSRLKVFVANRVGKILNTSSIDSWYHVGSENNGADIASRGASPPTLPPMNSWWAGPEWLIQPMEEWPVKSAQSYPSGDEEISEVKVVSYITRSEVETNPDEILQRFSSYPKMLRVLTYVYRFVSNIKAARKDRRIGRTLNVADIKTTERRIIKTTQEYYFGNDPARISHPPSLKSLSPFIDSHGLRRVGGRLRNAPINYEWKHPIILPPKSRLATLLIDHFHLVYLHAGPQLLLSLIKRRYWLPAGRNSVRSRVHKCLKCHRLRTATMQPLMGDLPPTRFEQGRPFVNVGLDFAGPFAIRESLRRKAALGKAYVCLFICMATKALHVEIVSSLSTEAFLAALDRFIARRGIPSKLFSDNGKTFVGANNKLRDLYRWWMNSDTRLKIKSDLMQREIRWEFIPPLAPNFGGLWEAGVKSFKHHFTRILTSQPLTYEELSTIAARIEAVLNSRPLCPQSAEIDDFDVLTPGHFLLGGPPTCAPEMDWSDTPANRLSRWQFLQKCIGDFWRRWKLDYISTLQKRVKWTKSTPNIVPGAMVLLRDERTQPLYWSVGRILAVYPGPDDIVRVAKIRTPQGDYVRPVNRLAPLFPEGVDST